MKKSNTSKLNTWKSNLNNRLYFFTSILILIILFVVVIYLTKQPIIAGKAFSVIYKDNTVGTFPLTITFTKDDTGVLTKEAAFKDDLKVFVLSIDNIVDGKIVASLTQVSEYSDGNMCGNGVCDEGESSNNCISDCPLPDLIVENVEYINIVNNQYHYTITLKNNGLENVLVLKSNDESIGLITRVDLYETINPIIDFDENWHNEDQDFILTAGATYTYPIYFDKDPIDNLGISLENIKLKVVADFKAIIAESNEENNVFWLNQETPLESNKLFSPPADGSWGSWVGQLSKINLGCEGISDSEYNNEYINNPFIPGTTWENQNLDDKYSTGETWVTEHYCDTTQSYFYGQDYNCPISGRYTTTISQKEVAACYCTLDTQCGYGWTCDLTQGDGDATKGKCVKNT